VKVADAGNLLVDIWMNRYDVLRSGWIVYNESLTVDGMFRTYDGDDYNDNNNNMMMMMMMMMIMMIMMMMIEIIILTSVT